MIALVQQQPYHTEIFGCFLNYCSDNNINIDIYFDYPDNATSYIHFYKECFNISNLNIFSFNDIYKNHHNYNKIIFTTITINDFNEILNIIDNKKIILFCHLREQYIDSIINISGTPLIRYNDIDVIQPFFKFKNEDKKNLSKNILILGNFYYKDIIDLKKNAKLFEDINYKFTIVSRKLINLKNNNILVFTNISTKDLMHLFKNTDYLLLLNKPNNIYHNDIMSGAVFQALSFGIPIICDKQYHDIYKYPESIVYIKSISEVIKTIKNISINNYIYKKFYFIIS
jgi:hypothetical protein